MKKNKTPARMKLLVRDDEGVVLRECPSFLRLTSEQMTHSAKMRGEYVRAAIAACFIGGDEKEYWVTTEDQLNTLKGSVFQSSEPTILSEDEFVNFAKRLAIISCVPEDGHPVGRDATRKFAESLRDFGSVRREVLAQDIKAERTLSSLILCAEYGLPCVTEKVGVMLRDPTEEFRGTIARFFYERDMLMFEALLLVQEKHELPEWIERQKIRKMWHAFPRLDDGMSAKLFLQSSKLFDLSS